MLSIFIFSTCTSIIYCIIIAQIDYKLECPFPNIIYCLLYNAIPFYLFIYLGIRRNLLTKRSGLMRYKKWNLEKRKNKIIGREEGRGGKRWVTYPHCGCDCWYHQRNWDYPPTCQINEDWKSLRQKKSKQTEMLSWGNVEMINWGIPNNSGNTFLNWMWFIRFYASGKVAIGLIFH